MAMVDLHDRTVRIKLAAAAGLILLAGVVGLRSWLFAPASERADAAALEAGNAVVQDLQARRAALPVEAGDEAAVEPGAGQQARPLR